MPANHRSSSDAPNNCRWLRNIASNWRDVECPCGSEYHFDGKIDGLFSWERVPSATYGFRLC